MEPLPHTGFLAGLGVQEELGLGAEWAGEVDNYRVSTGGTESQVW